MQKFGKFYNELYRYKKEHGDLAVKTKYVTPEGYELGRYVSGVRSNKYRISPSEKDKLDSLEFIWHANRPYTKRQSIEEVLSYLKEYKEEYKDVDVPRDYVTKEGIHLGLILSNIRLGIRKTDSTQRDAFKDMGVSFVRENYWENKKNRERNSFEEIVEALQAYKDEFGDCNVPQEYVSPNGMSLGCLIGNIKSGKRKVSNTQRQKLLDMGLCFCKHRKTYSFEEKYELFHAYYLEHEHCKIPFYYRDAENNPVGKLANQVRLDFDNLSSEEIKLLDAIHFSWEERKRSLRFEEKYKLLCEFKKEFGHLYVPQKYVTKDGYQLGRMVMALRQKGYLRKNERDMLNDIGFVWKVKHHRNATFEEVYQALEEYKEKYGNLDVPYYYLGKDDLKLGYIVFNIRTGHRKTSDTEKDKLNDIGFIWQKERLG